MYVIYSKCKGDKETTPWYVPTLEELSQILNSSENLTFKAICWDESKTDQSPVLKEMVVFCQPLMPNDNQIFVKKECFEQFTIDELKEKAGWGKTFGICIDDDAIAGVMPTSINYGTRICKYVEKRLLTG